MSDVSRYPARLPPEQEAFRAKCFHPSGTFVEFPREDVEHSVPARFEKIVGMYPDRIAIKLRGESLTYSELNCRANRLAQSLVDQYGDKAEPIAVLLENGPSLMAATLGVLKTGKFVVLMDSSFPDSRNAAILDDSGAKVVISEQENAPLVDRIASRDCRLMDIAATNSGVLTNDLRLRIPPDALAFLIYTSGSTGQPKGVMQDHRSRLRQYRWMTNTYHICAEDRSSLLNSGTAAAVDISLRPLMNGAMLLPFDLRREGVHRLACWLSHEKISLCVISSPLFRKLCETLSGEEGFPDLRLIRLSSETSYRSDFELYKKYFPPHCLLANGLSPTETGGLTVYFMDQRSYISGNEIPLGYALEDLKILLLDDDNRNVGFNQRGEIAVRSRYLSSGYWRRPALTEAKFKPDPGDKASRIYITGDLGIMLPDGCLLHKGRKDFRVKIRGYSVELAEVESVLRSHGAIDDAVVVARQHESGEARLIAYLTSSSEAPPTITDLRRFFEDRLPDYMIPSAFVTLDALPLTPSGKIDRAGLPDPEDFRRRLTTPLIAPRTCTEEKLAKIWARELHVDEIGVHDNFFDLGGHSLLAIRVVSLFCEDLQVEFSVSRFFKTPTVAGVADYIDMDHSVRDCVETPSIHGATKNEKLPLSFAQESLWFIDQLEPGRATYNLFSATRLTGPLDVRALEQSFNEIIRRHEALRTVFRTIDGVPFQIVLSTLTISLSVVDLRSIASAQEQEAEIGRICSKEAREPFDLARGPLLRVALLRLTAETYVLLLSVHHIVFDGSSRVVLDRELSILYRVFSRGESESLPALPAQYADFAQWQRRRLGNNHLK
ncbi:MAG TPA: AMP-binding protein, partial [Candidatus Binatia bacterium]